ncbi:MAG: hypothetical protein GQ546_02930 [Gammaproteobacteria bacterium]|nr:hypothetical protein [Gammaproteobacteria bacterium]
MYKKTLLSALVSASIVAGTTFSLVYADDRVEVEQPYAVEVEQPDVEVTDDGRKFDSSVRLEDTLVGWQDELLTEAGKDLKDAEEARAEDPDNEELQKAVADAEDNVTGLKEEQQKIEDLMSGKTEVKNEDGEVVTLTDEQIFALNRALNNATNNGLVVDFNSDYLEEVIAGEYNKQQTNAVTKALEEEAKFDKLSDKFTSKYDLTDNEKFLDKADMMTVKGERQKDKFLAKVDKFDRNNLEVDHQIKARKAARDSAKSTARDASKNSARKDAKRAAKNNAKKVAKENARNKEKSNNGKKKT